MEANQRLTTGSTSTVVELTQTVQTAQDEVGNSNRTSVELHLTLRPRPTVTWDESIINNEGLNRKSSKRCCIFHKKKEFAESDTESDEENDNDGNDSSSSSSGGGFSNNSKKKSRKRQGEEKKIAHRKAGQDKGHVPNYQRFHA